MFCLPRMTSWPKRAKRLLAYEKFGVHGATTRVDKYSKSAAGWDQTGGLLRAVLAFF